MAEEIPQQLDITGAEVVEVGIRNDGRVLWVNVNGICRLRVCRIKTLVLQDARLKIDEEEASGAS